ncbi:MAG: NAD(P)-binding domain-containing protein, partial [Acidimicrobiia bacterium]|nr:NAD(P)-binding domain-containing protein [Acidimicrobiia bacterium]
MPRTAVIGAGSWGTAVAALAARNSPTVLWARRADLAETIATARVNRDYLPDYQLPKGLHATSSLEEALDGAEVVVMGVPSHGFREILDEAKPFLTDGAPIISLTKGVEQDTLKRMTEVIADVAPDHPRGVLTGPNLAKEVMAGWPAASVVAIDDDDIA